MRAFLHVLAVVAAIVQLPIHAQETDCKDPRWVRVTVVEGTQYHTPRRAEDRDNMPHRIESPYVGERFLEPCDFSTIEAASRDGSRITRITGFDDRIVTEILLVEESLEDLCAVLNCADAVRGRR